MATRASYAPLTRGDDSRHAGALANRGSSIECASDHCNTLPPDMPPMPASPDAVLARHISMREHKAPLGPRAMDTGRRIVSTSIFKNNASRLPSATIEPFIDPANASHHPCSSFGKLPSRSTTNTPSTAADTRHCLPDVDLDHCFDNLASPSLNDFPIPGRSRVLSKHDASGDDANAGTMSTVAFAAAECKSNSRVQQTSAPAIRKRPPGPSVSTPPRGSCKPPEPALRAQNTTGNRPARGRDAPSGNSDQNRATGRATRPGAPRVSVARRSAGTTKQPVSASRSNASTSPDQRRHIDKARVATNNRLSSRHSSGDLGAQTKSPTDGVLLAKRMPIRPDTPGSPKDMPSRPSDTGHKPLPSSCSPAHMLEKAAIKSSPKRVTLDNPVARLPSNCSSFSSVRTTDQRPAQPLSSSRLATPRLPFACSSAESDSQEDVPPVPAIPKAYESPYAEIDRRMYSTTIATSNEANQPVNYYERPRRAVKLQHRSSLEADQSVVQRLNHPGTTEERTSSKLPPLNILPLRVTLHSVRDPDPSTEVNGHSLTTPPTKRKYNKFPSTPLTASNATFSFTGATDGRESNTASFHCNLGTHGFPHLPPPTGESVPGLKESDRNSSMASSSPRFLPQGDNGRQSSNLDADLEHSKADDLGEQTTYYSRENGALSPKPTTSTRRRSSFSSKSLPRASARRQASQGHAAYAHLNSHITKRPPKVPSSTDLPSSAPSAKRTYTTARRNVTGPLVENRRDVQTPASGPMTRSASNSFGHKTPLSKRPLGASPKGPASKPKSDLDNAKIDKQIHAGWPAMKVAIKDRQELLDRAARINAESETKAQQQHAQVGAGQSAPPADDISRCTVLEQFECGEKAEYKNDIFFHGTAEAKAKLASAANDSSANPGPEGGPDQTYRVVKGDHILYRYEIISQLGQGSFGKVTVCFDHKLRCLKAIKIINKAKRFYKQGLLEASILRNLREWDPERKHNLIRFTDQFIFRGHLCIATELLSMNLYELIKAHEFKGFTLDVIRRFATQLGDTLKFLKDKNLIHCDLKPENILLTDPTRSEIKIIDFGSSCYEGETIYSYIQSRFYRSPEVILGSTYGFPIDMWSFGCILAELWSGKPIFPGANEEEQLACIMEIFGPPEKLLLVEGKSKRRKNFFDDKGKPLFTSFNGLKRHPSSKTLQQSLGCRDETFLDFLTHCFCWNPDRRLTPEDAMKHKFITGKATAQQASTNQRPPTSSIPETPRLARRNVTTGQKDRPLPDPPGTSFKTGLNEPGAVVYPQTLRKPAVRSGRRLSTVSNFNPRRASIAAKEQPLATGSPNVDSALSRKANRRASGHLDMASAAATASLRTR